MVVRVRPSGFSKHPVKTDRQRDIGAPTGNGTGCHISGAKQMQFARAAMEIASDGLKAGKLAERWVAERQSAIKAP